MDIGAQAKKIMDECGIHDEAEYLPRAIIVAAIMITLSIDNIDDRVRLIADIMRARR